MAAKAGTKRRRVPLLPGTKPTRTGLTTREEAALGVSEEFRRGRLPLTLEAQRARARDYLAKNARHMLRAMLMLDGDDDAIDLFVKFLKKHEVWQRHLDHEADELAEHLRQHRAWLESIRGLPSAKDPDKPEIGTFEYALDEKTLSEQATKINKLDTKARQDLAERLRERGLLVRQAAQVLGESPDASRKRRQRARRDRDK